MRMSSPASRSICTVGVSVPADHRQAGHGTATSRPNWVWSCSDGCVLPDSTLVNVRGKPDAGNPLVRFDEGDQVQPWSLLYPILRRPFEPRSNAHVAVGTGAQCPA